MDYFKVENGYFVRDIELGFDYTEFTYPDVFQWVRYVDMEAETGEVDISQIPPSIFLLTLTNTQSSGLGMFIPITMAHHEFFRRLAKQFSRGYSNAVKFPDVMASRLLNRLDLDYINQHGSINYYLTEYHQLSKNDPFKGLLVAAQEFWDLINN